MIRFIWQNWWRRKERFILLIIGALIISIGLTYLVGLSETNKGTVVDELQQRWSSSYDIVVRPEGTRSVTEEDNLLDPNYLSGLADGISMKQYEKIKDIQNVEVAAPIAMIGYTQYEVNLAPLDYDEGIYRMRQDVMDSEIDDLDSSFQHYIAFGDWDIYEENLSEKGYDYFLTPPLNDLVEIRTLLLAAIDPEQEAKLVGLDQAIIQPGSGRYFTDEDTASEKPLGDTDINITNIPVIMSNQSFGDQKVKYTIERLDIPFDHETAEDTIEMLEEKGGEKYLDTLQGKTMHTYSFTDQDMFTRVVNSISGVDVATGEPNDTDYLRNNPTKGNGSSMTWRPSPLGYEAVSSPFPDTWPFAFRLETYPISSPLTGAEYVTFRNPEESPGFADNGGEYPRVNPKWLGYFDPTKLNISKDAKNELPMETYRPASANLVLDASRNPVNPPKQLKPSDSGISSINFLAYPPTMLATMDAAEMIIGDQPISSIRIKVAGVSNLSEGSQQIIDRVAADIERETGLITDITLGSSPQPTLVQVPAVNDKEELGWFQQPWIKIGASISIFRETKIGFSGLLISIIAVAVIYVWASSLVSLLTRRKEFAVLLAVGWRPQQLSRLLFLESTIMGTFVAIISWMMLGFVYISEEAAIDPLRFVFTGLFGFLVYLLGAAVPAYLAQSISPYEAMRTGEISRTSKRLLKTRGLISMACNHFIGKWKRSLLSIIAIALPTSLLALFLFVTFRLKGIMYTTWLGQYVALEVGPVQYTAMIVALIIAILTTAEIMWQNIAEREQEISLLKAVGWKNNSVRLLIWTEGLFSGIFAAVIGLALAFGMIWGLYHQIPIEEIQFILATGLIPILVGVIGTILPAERAVRISPVHGVGGNLTIRKVVEKRLKWMVIVVSLLLIGAFFYTIVQVILYLK